MPVDCRINWVGVQWGQYYLMAKDVSLTFFGHPFNEGDKIKIPYGADVSLH